MCGIVGLYHPKENVAGEIYDALIQVQHRGQDAAGIATWDSKKLSMHKELGVVTEVFKTPDSLKLDGNIGIGHVRYPTAGCSDVSEAQPFYSANPVTVALAHNGTLTNSESMKNFLLETHFCQFNTGSDSEILLNLFAFELSQTNFDTLSNEHVFRALKKVYARCEGGFAVTMLVGGVGLVAFRDSNGIRPLVLGKNDEGSRMVASESSALSALGYNFERDVSPGEAIIISEAGSLDFSVCSSSVSHSPCLFEFVYFSRPDSVIDSISVHKSRLRMGDYLGEKILKEFSHLEIDAVVPVPDTSRTSAMQVAHKLGIKYREGFIKNRYIGRTFIMPGQSIRKRSVAHKLSPIEIEFKNKNVLLVDDSIVRGNTSKKIVEMVRNNGAKKVYFASAAPPVRYQNVYGIDMPATKELVAHGRNIEEIKEFIGADELIYQDIEALRMAAHVGNTEITQFEDSVFTGKYCAGKISKDYLEKLETSRANKK
jgi:amidophosphoribosyltransferase|tara:strand:- start:17 stop:1468 length:1452 start_codon:yes stop_codon:yes gene_type:complete